MLVTWDTAPAIRNFKWVYAETLGGRLGLDLEQRMRIVTRNAEEVVTPEEMRKLLETETKPRAYWGFECSGQ